MELDYHDTCDPDMICCDKCENEIHIDACRRVDTQRLCIHCHADHVDELKKEGVI